MAGKIYSEEAERRTMGRVLLTAKEYTGASEVPESNSNPVTDARIFCQQHQFRDPSDSPLIFPVKTDRALSFRGMARLAASHRKKNLTHFSGIAYG